MKVKLYMNENQTRYAVLVSTGYGAGFSSWNYEEMAWDSRVVNWYVTHNTDELIKVAILNSPENIRAREWFESIGYEHVYLGGS